MKYIAAGFAIAALIVAASFLSPFEQEQRQALALAESPQASRADETDGRFYHEVKVLSNGTKIGTLGSLSYILDAYGDRMSGGFHSIKIDGAGYVATLGTKTYRLDSSGAVSGGDFEYDFVYEYEKK